VSSYEYRLEKGLISFLNKVHKKDKKLYEAAMKKIEDIVENPHHYKPLRYDLKGRRKSSYREILCSHLQNRRRGEESDFFGLLPS
jgi:mRNA-degrading endonuclease RelE of RelBE toxin-antitoxin system